MMMMVLVLLIVSTWPSEDSVTIVMIATVPYMNRDG